MKELIDFREPGHFSDVIVWRFESQLNDWNVVVETDRLRSRRFLYFLLLEVSLEKIMLGISLLIGFFAKDVPGLSQLLKPKYFLSCGFGKNTFRQPL